MINYIKVYIVFLYFIKVFGQGIYNKYKHFPLYTHNTFSDIRDMGIEGKEGLGIGGY